ncbi:insulinase family protein [Parasporobacterium paucivorans]|uniref:Peptidase M16C associated domain-containing protein n=1 Tax=Parasporobacterium paucivorans DSM 15970 TaxID=1122934 RepID=A0A1M6FKT9_9FIRM|nr:insulinase family protein [Parasporobacterium paucivorans]SHI98242.1 hypothetical protein SAMN02745691_01134 [Parasporobacterium paucivorans DSM 15970]
MGIINTDKYDIIKEHDIRDLNSEGILLKHKKTGAKIFIMKNDDENKVFYIGFRTPPKDDTGLPHILEHSVLCGSRKYPAKDPFVELVKGSLNTFLNAMTYPDKTVYPVASCNDKDFQNLMNVYMDAVFYPNIYVKDEIFRQEGWNYSLESPDADIEYNGVVFNEMKGAFSSPESVLEREILHYLYPDTSYSFESGGNPKKIPELRYEDFIAFHKKYYHPSNSYIYLYGDMDFEEKLEWLDREYLSSFTMLEVESEIATQPPFRERRDIRLEYPVSEAEPEENNTYISFNTSVGHVLDKELYVAFQVIENALVSMPGAPVKRALTDAGIGKDILGTYDNGLLQPYFSITAKNTNEDRKEEFLVIINEVLEKTVKEGIDKDSLRAGLNSLEFKYREADFGAYPKGLIIGLQALDSWLYDESDPFMHIEELQTFAFLKEQIGTDYYENLIKEYILGNPHTLVLTLVPRKGLSAQEDDRTAESLKAFKESLSEEQIQELVDKTAALEAYQDEPSTEEEINSIPILKREDLKIEPEPFSNNVKEIDGVKVIHHEMFTNGIAYIELLFNANGIPEELIPYLGLLPSILGYMDTDKYPYSELNNAVNIHTGGIAVGNSMYTNSKDNTDYLMTSEIRTKVLYENIPMALSLMEEILFHTKTGDEKRLYEIVAQLKSRLQMSLNSSGHSAASLRSMSYYSVTAYLRELTNGIEFYKFIENLEKNFESEKENVISRLNALLSLLKYKENLIVSVTGDSEGFSKSAQPLGDFISCLRGDSPVMEKPVLKLSKKNEGFKTSAAVQYVARCGNFVDAGFAYTGVLKILKVIMNYEYLWQNIRVKGGAYGCMSSYSRTGDTCFVSYRDPNLAKTLEVYNGITGYLRSFMADEREMTKFIIGTVSGLDTPLNPSDKGSRSLNAYLSNLSYEDIQRERLEVIQAVPEDIRKLADMIEQVLQQNYICAIGNENKIEQEGYLFDNIRSLYE